MTAAVVEPASDGAKPEKPKRASRARKPRASGESQVAVVTKEESEKNDEPITPELPDETAQKFRTPGFHRFRTDWSDEDASMKNQILTTVNDQIVNVFADAYIIMEDLYEIVRTPEVDAKGDAVRDTYGFVVYQRTPAGGWEEDFSKLSARQRENFIFMITTRIFAWEQRAADAWSEAMFAKAKWEERFSIGYEEPERGTIEDRTARGRIDSREERYFAIFVSTFSRKADAITRTMALLAQRLKDSMAT